MVGEITERMLHYRVQRPILDEFGFGRRHLTAEQSWE